MLITETIMVRWHNLTSRHYINKGYTYTKQGDLFEAKVEDLTPRSNRKVVYECDYCHERHEVFYSIFNRQREQSIVKKDACTHCTKFKTKEQAILRSQQNLESNISSIEKINSIQDNMKNYSKSKKTKKIDVYNIDIFSLEEDPQTILKIFQKEFKERGYILLNKKVKSDSILEFKCLSHKNRISSVSYEEFKSGKGCFYCRKERDNRHTLHNFNYCDYKKFFSDRDCTLISDSIPNRKRRILFKCSHHPELGVQKTTFAVFKNNLRGCRQCGYDQNKGSNHHFWKGGISPLNIYLRGCVDGWKKESMKACEYKCVLTGDEFDDVHHLYSFGTILQVALKQLNYPVDNLDINNFSEFDLRVIERKVVELHYQLGFGVCLRRDVHDLFHELYGRVNNTPEEFEEFKERFKSGELDSKLPQKLDSSSKKVKHFTSSQLFSAS